jgi:hypothetical protein
MAGKALLGQERPDARLEESDLVGSRRTIRGLGVTDQSWMKTDEYQE